MTFLEEFPPPKLTNFQWLKLAGKLALALPDQDADWKYVRVGDAVIFAHHDHIPMIGDEAGLREIRAEVTS